MQIRPSDIKNILVIRNDRFGEFLLNIPAFRAIRETFKFAKLTVITDPYAEELAKRITFIDEVITWRQESHSLLSMMRLVGLLRRKDIDIAVMLNPSKEFNIVSYLAGIPVRAGYDRKWGFLLNYKTKDEKCLGKRHEVEYNLELAGLIGAKTHDKSLSLDIDTGPADKLMEDFNITDNGYLVALHPWTSDPVKQWPKENFKELARRLALEPDIKLVIIGGKEEARKDSGLFNGCAGANTVNLAGQTTLTQLAALLKKCRVLISGDSGPVHLACCVGVPVIALFRNDIPGKSAKRWGPWGAGNIIIERNNLSEITTQEVLEKAREKIGKISHN
jgi:heptosyltransferase II